MALNPMKWLDASAKFKELLELTEKTSMALSKISEDVQALKVEVERLKAREEVVIMSAKAAASEAAMRATGDLSRDVGRLEAQVVALGGRTGPRGAAPRLQRPNGGGE